MLAPGGRELVYVRSLYSYSFCGRFTSDVDAFQGQSAMAQGWLHYFIEMNARARVVVVLRLATHCWHISKDKNPAHFAV